MIIVSLLNPNHFVGFEPKVHLKAGEVIMINSSHFVMVIRYSVLGFFVDDGLVAKVKPYCQHHGL